MFRRIATESYKW